MILAEPEWKGLLTFSSVLGPDILCGCLVWKTISCLLTDSEIYLIYFQEILHAVGERENREVEWIRRKIVTITGFVGQPCGGSSQTSPFPVCTHMHTQRHTHTHTYTYMHACTQVVLHSTPFPWQPTSLNELSDFDLPNRVSCPTFAFKQGLLPWTANSSTVLLELPSLSSYHVNCTYSRKTFISPT